MIQLKNIGLFVACFLLLTNCRQACFNQVFLETLEMDFQVNGDNLGINPQNSQNSGDTIRSTTNQFYNFPETRRFGQIQQSQPWYNFFIETAYAADDDCPESIEYTTRLNLEKTEFYLNVPYDASALGLGIIAADTDLMTSAILKDAYLTGFTDNPFIRGGAPTPLTIDKEFFRTINNQRVLISLYFEEENGMAFTDSIDVFVQMTY